MVLDCRGQAKWIYNGGDKHKSGGDKFSHRDITVTTGGLILITDTRYHSIHVLNQTGVVFYCHTVNDLGIEGPFSLESDDNGFLWVGCNTKKTK